MGYEAAARSARGPLLIILYFVASRELNSSQRLRELRGLLIISSILLGVVGIAGSTGLLMPMFPELAVGLLQPGITRDNFYAEPALAIAYIVFLLLTLILKPDGDRISTRLLTYTGLLLDTAMLMLSVTRGFWIGMAVAITIAVGLLIFYKQISARGMVATVFTFVTAVAIVEFACRIYGGFSVLDVFGDRATAAALGADANVDTRIREFVAYGNSFMGSPLLGNGYGAPALSVSTDTSAGFAHDEYILMLQATGLLGFLVFGAFLISVLRAVGRRLWNPSVSRLSLCFDISIVATLLGFAVVSISSGEFTNPSTAPLVATLLAVGSRQFNMSERLQRVPLLRQYS